MTCAEAAACVGRLPVVVVSTRRRGCFRSLFLVRRQSKARIFYVDSCTDPVLVLCVVTSGYRRFLYIYLDHERSSGLF